MHRLPRARASGWSRALGWSRAFGSLALRIIVGLLLVFAAVSPAAARASATSSGAPPGTIGLRLVDVPAGTAKDPRAKLYIVDHVAPGTTIHRRIEVANGSTSAAHVNLYAAAASITGGSFIGAAGRARNEVSTWISVDPGESAVPGRGAVTANVTISIPADAAPGEDYAAVWAETRLAPADGGGVTIVNRVGIRVYLSVGPGGAPAADFTIDSLTAERADDGRPVVLAAVRNVGGRALDMFGTLKLASGPGGLSAGPYPATLGTTVAIGDTEIVTIQLDKRIPAGPWDAIITLHSGLLERTAHATITFPDTGASSAVEVAPVTPLWLPFAVGGLAILAVIASLLVARDRRRRGVRETVVSGRG